MLCLYPATPGWGVQRGRACLGLGFGCALPLLARVFGLVCVCVRAPPVPRHSWLVCGMGVCALARVSAAPRHSWLGCWGLRVCLCVCSACTPRLLAEVCTSGVRAWALVSAAPRHSWLGCLCLCVFVCVLRLYPATPGWCVVWVSVLWLGFRLHPATPGWGAGVCVCVCVRARLVPRHSWLGCALWVCVLGLGFWLCAATLGWGVGWCASLCARSACTPPLLAGVAVGVRPGAWGSTPRHSWLGCWVVCVFVCALRLYPATPGWGVWCGYVCLSSGFDCAPPLLTGFLGCVCVCLRVPLCPLQLLAGVCGEGVFVWARVSSAPRHSWPGCVCAFVCPLGFCPATLVWTVRCVDCLLPGTCSCAVLRCGLCALPGFAAAGSRYCLAPILLPSLWPAGCLSGVPGGGALARHASSGLVALGAPVSFADAVVPFPNPGACPPGFTGRLRGARRGQPRTGLFALACGRCRGSGDRLAPSRTRSGPRDGVVPGR